MALTIWTNARVTGEAAALLARGLSPYRRIGARQPAGSNLESGPADEGLLEAEVVFGQPDPAVARVAPKLRWIHLNSAGHTRYDDDVFRSAMAAKGVAVTTSSTVYAEPCAEHVLAMMLGVARRLPESLEAQRGDRSWPMRERRARSALLRGQRVLLLGFGAIGRRLVELLGPFDVDVTALRRRVLEPADRVRIIDRGGLEAAIALADHVVDLLPENDETIGFVDARLLSRVKRGAAFYNVGRGRTVDQGALLEALRDARLGAAYLDVTTPEPLPPDHPLWTARRCFITPHTAGGHVDEEEDLVRHFLENLDAFVAGRSLRDRVI